MIDTHAAWMATDGATTSILYTLAGGDMAQLVKGVLIG